MTENNSNDTFKLRKFSGKIEDYQSWQRDFVAVMRFKGLLYIIKADQEPTPNDDSKKEEYKERNGTLYSYLVLSLDDTNARSIEIDCYENGWKAWRKITSKYQRRDKLRAISLYLELCTTRLSNCENMEHYLGKTADIRKQLIDISGSNAVPNDLAIASLFLGLTDEFSQWIYSKGQVENLTVEEVETELRTLSLFDEDKRRLSENPVELGFMIKNLNQKSGRKLAARSDKRSNDNGNKKKKCDICLKNGHTKEDCWHKDDPNYKPKEKKKGVATNFMINTSSHVVDSNTWIVDTGASNHMCNIREAFKTIETSNIKYVIVANGAKVEVEGQGTMELILMDTNAEPITAIMEGVLFVPKLEQNLLSVRKLGTKGHRSSFTKNGGTIEIAKTDKTVPIREWSKMFVIDCQINYPQKETDTDSAMVVKETEGLWHQRMGHPGKDVIQKLAKCVEGINIPSHEEVDPQDCEVCIATKMAKTPFQESTSQTTRPLELVHSDVEGPMRTPSFLENHKFAINFIDDYSKFTVIYTMKQKSEAFDKFKMFIADFANPINAKIGTLQTDDGGEYVSNEMEKYCRDVGIRREKSIPRTPEQNGKAERKWRTLFNMVRAMLLNAGLGKIWWGRALTAAAYLRNRLPSSTLPEGTTPFELFYGRKPTIRHIKTFGCRVFILNDNPQRDKLDNRGLPGIFVGYGDKVKGYLVYVFQTNRMIWTRNIKFLESSHPEIVRLGKAPQIPKGANLSHPSSLQNQRSLPSNQNDATIVNIKTNQKSLQPVKQPAIQQPIQQQQQLQVEIQENQNLPPQNQSISPPTTPTQNLSLSSPQVNIGTPIPIRMEDSDDEDNNENINKNNQNSDISQPNLTIGQ